VWWLFAGLAEIDRAVASEFVLSSALVFVTATALIAGHAARRLEWEPPRVVALLLLPAMLVAAISSRQLQAHPLAHAGWIAWPLAYAGFYYLLRRHEEGIDSPPRTGLHVVGIWLLAFILSTELEWLIAHALPTDGVWPYVAWGIVPAAVIMAITRLSSGTAWPIGARAGAYLGVAAPVFATYLLLWSLITNVSSDGNAAPLPYFPLVNPLDVAQAFVLLAIGFFVARARAAQIPALHEEQWRVAYAGIAFTVFIWLNAILLRTLHYWSGVPWDFEALTHSTLVQTSLSIFWAVLAFATMLFGTRRTRRFAWFVGAGLMAIVVVKLVIVDLRNVATVARIVSFIGVGLLMLVVNYFAPFPRGGTEAES